MKIVEFQDEQPDIVTLHGIKYAVIKVTRLEDTQEDGSSRASYKTYLKKLPSWVNEGSFGTFIAKNKKKLVKELKKKLISELTVTTESGNTLDADDKALSNMTFAIQAAEVVGATEHSWKLADNTVRLMPLDELKEALALGIQAKGTIILAEDVDA